MIDKDFKAELRKQTAEYNNLTHRADTVKWSIAYMVNDWWPEHQSIFQGDKLAYYIECSRVANEGHSVRIFGSSGQTLRRWCEIQQSYSTMPMAEEFLKSLSFDHLAKARKLYNDELVPAPDLPLAKALSLGWSADEMVEQYTPFRDAVHPYDGIRSSMDKMLDPKSWEWINDKSLRGIVHGLIKKVDDMLREYIQNSKQVV